MPDVIHTNPASRTRVQAGPASASPGRDRRRSVREPFFVVGTLKLDDATDKTLQVLVLNVSLHGVGFRCPCGLPAGRTYEMRLGSGPLLLGSRLQIVASRRREDGTYDVGAKFV